MIAPSKLQKGAAKTVVSLLEKLSIIQRVASYEKVQLVVKNSPYEPLEISKQGDVITLTTFVNEEGNLVVDSKGVFEVDFAGILCFQLMKTRGSDGQKEVKNETTAGMFATSLFNHGYDQGKVIWIMPKDPTQVVEESEEMNLTQDLPKGADLAVETGKHGEKELAKEEQPCRYSEDPRKIFGNLFSEEQLGHASLETFMPLDTMTFRTKEGDISNGIWLIKKDYIPDVLLERARTCIKPLQDSNQSSEALWREVQDHSQGTPMKYEFSIKGYKKGDLQVYSTMDGDLVAFLADQVSWLHKIMPDFRLLYFKHQAMALVLSGSVSAGLLKRIILDEIAGVRVSFRYLGQGYQEEEEADEPCREREYFEMIERMKNDIPEINFSLDTSIGEISRIYDLMTDRFEQVSEMSRSLISFYRKKLNGLGNSESSFSKTTLLKINEIEAQGKKYRAIFEGKFKAARDNIVQVLRAELEKTNPSQNVSEWLDHISVILFVPTAQERKMLNDDSITSSTTVRDLIEITKNDMLPEKEHDQDVSSLISSLKPLSLSAEKIFGKLIVGIGKGGSRKIDTTNGTYMPVHVEWLYDNVYSIAHYWEQNGDLMSDPRMEFMVVGDKVYPVYFRQDGNPARENEILEYDEKGNLKIRNIRVQKDIARFANTWMQNIKEQQSDFFRSPIPPDGNHEKPAPWTMTRVKYIESLGLDARYFPPKPMRLAAKLVKMPDGNYWSTDEHGKSVYDAVRGGKPVPKEVLEEYIAQPWAKQALGIEIVKSSRGIQVERNNEEPVVTDIPPESIEGYGQRVMVTDQIPLPVIRGQAGTVLSSRIMPDMERMYTVRLDIGQLTDPFDGQMYDPEINGSYLNFIGNVVDCVSENSQPAALVADAPSCKPFSVGDRVMLISGQFEGRHGVIEDINYSHLTVVDGESSKMMIFRVKTDNGLTIQVTDVCIQKETSRPTDIIPDILTDKGYELPENVFTSVHSYKKRLEDYNKQMVWERDRYKRSTISVTAQALRDQAKYLAECYRNWAEKYPEEAKRIKEKHSPLDPQKPAVASSTGKKAATTSANQGRHTSRKYASARNQRR